MKKKRNIVSLIFILLGFVALMLWILSLVLSTGKSLKEFNLYLEIAYYIGAAALILYFLIIPFFTVLFAPPFSYRSVAQKLEGTQKKKVVEAHYRKMKKLSKRLIRKKQITDENAKLLKESMKGTKGGSLVLKDQRLQEQLSDILKNDIKKDMRKIVIESARDTLYLTALSQNNTIDILIVVVNNFRMLKKLVKRAGFRPSFFRLLKFYINVALASLIADGAEKLDIQNMFGNLLPNLAKPIVGSLVEGSINAFFMLRSGFLAMQYIFNSCDDETTKNNLMNSAFAEAAKALPELTSSLVITPIANAIKGTVVNPTKKAIKKLFHKEEPLEIK